MRIRSSLSAFGVALMTVGAIAATAAPAGAADVASGSYRIVSAATPGTCLTSSQEPRDMTRLGDCGDATWNIVPASDGNGYAIQRAETSSCLALSPLRIYPPRTWIDDCDGPWRHSWTVTDTGRGTVQLSPASDQNGCLTGTNNGGPAVVLPCGSDPRQDWRLIPTD